MPEEKRTLEKLFIGISVTILILLVGGYIFFTYAEKYNWLGEKTIFKEEPTAKEVIESNRQWIANSTTKY